ncbi:DsbA family protein [Flavobacterium sp. FlaQc-57]|uniref:DsbA family protein n=1 Tax=Flavobacterium sp. FlaQc-57 TaxID=3374186 RepID=UPI0037581FC0
MSENKINPLLCDPETGFCEMPGVETDAVKTNIKPGKKPIKIIYYTDPICSSCWGIEPQLRKLKLEYGDYFEIDYRMGGLLPDWSYNSGGISKPSDVAHHWEEASLYYEMPIDGDVWLEDPLNSSYPSCIAMKAAQMQDKEKAISFMRIIREKLYLDKKNIAKWENIAEAAKEAQLDVERLKSDFDGSAQQLFKEDLEYGKTLGIRGFPTMLFSDGSDKMLTVYGSKPYQFYENTLLELYPKAQKQSIINNTDPMFLFDVYPSLAVKEYAVILDKTTTQAKAILEQLAGEGKLEKKMIKTGVLYIKK